LVYRGVAYDVTDFIKKHPAGAYLVRLGVGRDATALLESTHLRQEVAAASVARLPKIADFPVDAVPPSPRPNDSPLYNALRDRVRTELFGGGGDARGAHRRGSEAAAATIVAFAVAAYTAYALAPGIVTGAWLGLAGAWIGLTIQHCGNHGAMSTSPLINRALGACDDLIGGSSLAWQYQHQVSHHIHCNGEDDTDAFSAWPLLRFDPSQPARPWHAWQHVYVWALYPLMQFAFQYGDWKCILTGEAPGSTMHGATLAQRAGAAVGKLVHYALLMAVPYATHGAAAAAVGTAAYVSVLGVVLAATFAVSHNVREAKPPVGPGAAPTPAGDALAAGGPADRDWGVQQVTTSVDYGGAVANFLTGGLSLQVAHHLFPAVSFGHYPAIAAIVEDECAKRGVPYTRYPSLWDALKAYSAFMRDVGRAP
jgi:fatty acid desaturase (delta-4 desaturase)